MDTNKLSPAINHIAKLNLDFSLIPKHYNHILINYHDNRNTFLSITHKDTNIYIDITLINNIYCNDVTCAITLNNNVLQTCEGKELEVQMFNLKIKIK